MTTHNPAGLDTDLPTLDVYLTPFQQDEIAHRITITAETDELTDWGFITSRTLRVLPDRVGDADGDLQSIADILRDASNWRGAESIDRVRMALADQAARHRVRGAPAAVRRPR